MEKITDTSESKQPPSGHFELSARIPGMGEVSLKLYPEGWNKFVQCLQSKGGWLVFALFLSVFGLANNPIISRLLPTSLSGTEHSAPNR